MFKKRVAVMLVLVVVASIHLFFALKRINNFTGGDETLWSYQRVPDFWKAVATQNWKKTNISDKPGITLVLLSGMGLPFAPDPKPYGDLMYSTKTPAQLDSIRDIYFHLRLPILIFSLVAIFIFFFLLEKLLGTRTALLSTIFIALSPILVGMSIYVNSDSLLWIFMPLAILSFLTYQKLAKRKYLLLSGIFFGLALLTKYVAAILFPFIISLIIFDYIFKNNPDNMALYFKKALIDFLILLGTLILVICFLYPAVWVKPRLILEATVASRPFLKIWPVFLGVFFLFLLDTFGLKKYFTHKISAFILKYRLLLASAICAIAMGLILFVIINVYSKMEWIDFPLVLSNPRVGANQNALMHINGEILKNGLTSFYSLIFGLTPLVALLFIFTLGLTLKKSRDFSLLEEKNSAFLLVLYCVFFILAYYAGSSLLGVSSMVRYQVALYPFASIIAAVGLLQLVGKLDEKKYYGLLFLLIIFSSYSLYAIKPFYLEYSSSFLPQKYAINLDNSGEGSFELAQYLNRLPNAENLYVWTDIRQVCEKFVGRCAFGLKGWSASDVTFDYFVVPVVERDNNLRFKNSADELKIGSTLVNFADFYAVDRNYAFKFTIDNREITTVKIIKNNL